MEVHQITINPHYNLNYTRSQIKAVLQDIKECVAAGRFQISMNENRRENVEFINEYNIYPKKRKRILMQIALEDFCYSLQNTKKGYEDEVLYVFVPRFALFNAVGEHERIDIYTKFNLIERPDGNRIVVISFHKLNKPVDYLFRQENSRRKQQ